MDSAFRDAVLTALQAQLTVFGTAVQFVRTGATTAVDHTALIVEAPDAVEQTPHGHERERVAVFVVPAPAFDPPPAPGDRFVVASGVHAGDWRVIGIDARDAAVLRVRARFAVRSDAATPGAREVRR